LDKRAKTTEPVVFYPNEVTKDENPTFMARTLGQRYSSWKLMAVAELIKGVHVEDALNRLDASNKKGADIMRKVLMSAIFNGTIKGYYSQCFFVKEVVVGKALSHKKVDIKGRGRMGTIKVPKSSLTIVLEEKSMSDYQKMILKG